MKYKYLIIAALTTFFQLSLTADSFLGDCIDTKLEVVYSYNDTQWTMGLSDGSSWKLFPMTGKRQQSWTEWWKGAEPKEWQLEEDYFFDPYNWQGNYTIGVYKARDGLSSQSKYILVNENTQQKVFAEFIPQGTALIPKIEYAMQLLHQAKSSTTEVLGSYHLIDDLLVLHDNTMWKLHPIDQNSPTWSQWWNNVEIDQPDQIFLTKVTDWKQRDLIEIYPAHIDNTELLKKYSVLKPSSTIYILENKARKKLAYATPINFLDFIELVEKETEEKVSNSYREGKYAGYQEGYEDGRQIGEQEGYERGYKSGSPPADPIRFIDQVD